MHFAETLIERELQQRNGKRIEQNKRRAGFPVHKSLDEFDYGFQTTISKREVNSLVDFGFIETQENVVFIGSPDVGKTHLAIGLGLKAIEAGYKVCSSTAPTLKPQIVKLRFEPGFAVTKLDNPGFILRHFKAETSQPPE